MFNKGLDLRNASTCKIFKEIFLCQYDISTALFIKIKVFCDIAWRCIFLCHHEGGVKKLLRNAGH